MAKITAHMPIQLYGGTEKLDLPLGTHEVDECLLGRILKASPGSERLFRAACTLHQEPTPAPVPTPVIEPKRQRRAKFPTAIVIEDDHG